MSPCLFNCYLRDLVIAILSTKVGCNIGGLFVNILAYADDVVLLAPSWSALQLLINMLADCALTIDMLCNAGGMLYHPRLLLETEQNRAGYCHHVCLTVT